MVTAKHTQESKEIRPVKQVEDVGFELEWSKSRGKRLRRNREREADQEAHTTRGEKRGGAGWLPRCRQDYQVERSGRVWI